MALEHNISKELREAISAMVDARAAVSMRCLVNVEVKPEKYESRVLALGSCRCYVFTTKVPPKLDATVHYLDINGIESMSTANLRLTLKNGKILSFTAHRANVEDLSTVIAHIGASLAVIFPTLPFERLVTKLEIHPTSRAKALQDVIKEASSADSKPCDGFSTVYLYMCDYLGYAPIEEVTWDVDTIYSSQDARTFCLQDFSHLSSSDHVPLLAALQYSTWFTHFNAADMKLSSDMMGKILKVIKTSMTLKSVNLFNAGLKSDSIQKLASAIAANSSSNLTELNLSNNAVEDKGIATLSMALGKLPLGLHYINLSKTNITARGAGKLADALMTNGLCISTLRVLNLGSNTLKGEELQSLYTFLSKPNVLEKLDLSGAGSSLEQLVSALSSGCLQHLRVLKAAGNPYMLKKSKEPPPYWKHFFSSAQSLRSINLSNTSLPPNALKALLLGLSMNASASAATAAMSLDISHNNLGSDGANIISACVDVLRNISSLDLTNNGLEEGLAELLSSFVVNKSIRHLSIGQNFSFVKSKHMTSALDALVQVMQSDHSVLESLSVADSKLGQDTSRIINVLGSNMTMKKIDLSGNEMGDDCAKMLAKALSINSSVTSLSFDRNCLSAVGLSDIAHAVNRNMCVRDIPLPLDDIIVASKLETEKVKSAVDMLQRSLLRNHSCQPIPRDNLYRLQANLHMGAAQSVIDKKIGRLQSLLASLTDSSASSKQGTPTSDVESVSHMEMAIKDATSARKAMTKLYAIAQKSEAGSSEMYEQAEKMSKQLLNVVQSQAQNSAREMLRSMQEDFPFVFAHCETAQSELTAGCEELILRDEAFQADHMTKRQLVTSVCNELSRLNLAVATYIFDNIIDKLLLALGEVGKLTSRLPGMTASANEIPNSVSLRSADEEPKKTGDSQEERNGRHRLASEDETAAAGNSTRKALLNGRKRRPQSLQQDELSSAKTSGTHFVLGGFGRKLRKGSAAAAATGAVSTGGSNDVDLDAVCLSTDAPQLSHPTKDRPKPQRVHVRRPAASPADQGDDDQASFADDAQALDGSEESPAPDQHISAGAPKKSHALPQGPPRLPPKDGVSANDKCEEAAQAAMHSAPGESLSLKDKEYQLSTAEPPVQTALDMDASYHQDTVASIDQSSAPAGAAESTGSQNANSNGSSGPKPSAPMRTKKVRPKPLPDNQYDTSLLTNSGTPTNNGDVSEAGPSPIEELQSRRSSRPSSTPPPPRGGQQLIAELSRVRSQHASNIIEEPEHTSMGCSVELGKEVSRKPDAPADERVITLTASSSSQSTDKKPVASSALTPSRLAPPLPVKPAKPVPGAKPALGARSKAGTAAADAVATSSSGTDVLWTDSARSVQVPSGKPKFAGGRSSLVAGGEEAGRADGADSVNGSCSRDAVSALAAAVCTSDAGFCFAKPSETEVASAYTESSALAEASLTTSVSLRKGRVLVAPGTGPSQHQRPRPGVGLPLPPDVSSSHGDTALAKLESVMSAERMPPYETNIDD